MPPPFTWIGPLFWIAFAWAFAGELPFMRRDGLVTTAVADRGSKNPRRSLEVPLERVDLVANSGLAADLVVQHSSPTSISLTFEHLEVEKLSVGSLDVKRFDGII